MSDDVLAKSEFASLMHKHIEEILLYLFDQNREFGIFCDMEHVGFSPQLPSHITEPFEFTTLFMLAGYTFESARFEDGSLVFEAGFGEENIGSFVTVPLLSILQVVVNDMPILINSATFQQVEKKENDTEENSMEALLSNPKNRKFLRDKAD